jgi:hypothetical protein
VVEIDCSSNPAVRRQEKRDASLTMFAGIPRSYVLGFGRHARTEKEARRGNERDLVRTYSTKPQSPQKISSGRDSAMSAALR